MTPSFCGWIIDGRLASGGLRLCDLGNVKIIRDLSALPSEFRSGAVAIGNFDGVHLGHARIVQRLIDKSKQLKGPAVVFTFDPHPVRILRPEQAPPPLTWTERKAELLAGLGVDWMVAYPTDAELLGLSPQQFFNDVVRERLDARAMVEGPNFYFGKDRTGTIEVLRELCTQQDIPLEVVPPVEVDGAFVSSSRIRGLMAQGDVDAAARLLTRPYRIRGMVTHGAGRGAKIGFPTANLEAVDTLLPGQGVYAGRGFAEGQSWPAAINIGPNPTFGEDALKVEIHLVGRRDPLYGAPLEVDFLGRLRGIERFSSVESLQSQLAADVARAVDIAKEP